MAELGLDSQVASQIPAFEPCAVFSSLQKGSGLLALMGEGPLWSGQKELPKLEAAYL